MKRLDRAAAWLCALVLVCLFAPSAALAQPAADSGGANAYSYGDNSLRMKGFPAVVGGGTVTTPAGTSGYNATTANLIANSATAGSVAPFTFTGACSVAGGAGAIEGARLKTADTGFAGKTVVLQLYKLAPTFSNGDHGAWLTTESDWIGAITIVLGATFTDYVKGRGTPDLPATANGASLLVFDCAPASTAIYGVEVSGSTSITPQGAKAHAAVLEVLH